MNKHLLIIMMGILFNGQNGVAQEQEPLERWKADPVKLQKCLDTKPPRHEDATDPSKLYKPGVSPWPTEIQGEGDLNLVVQATRRQIEACEKSRAALSKTVKIGTCSLHVADWCDRSGREVQALALKILSESKGQTPAELYKRFLQEMSSRYDLVTLLGPQARPGEPPVDRESHTLLTAYYSPTLEASRVKTPIFKYPIFLPPPGLKYVDIGNGKKGWRVPKKGGGWEQLPARSVVEAEDGRYSGKVLAYLNDPLDRARFYVEGAGTVNVREADGRMNPRRAQYKAGNSYPNNMIARVVRCELIQRGPPYAELKDGKWVVKPEYTKGEGLRKYVRDSEQPIWSKFHELNAFSESIIFFDEGPKKEAGGMYNLLLTADVSLASDQRLVPFGFPVLITDAGNSFVGFSQDTGGVIKGAQFDIFVGEGRRASDIANSKADFGTSRVLVPKGCHR